MIERLEGVPSEASSLNLYHYSEAECQELQEEATYYCDTNRGSMVIMLWGMLGLVVSLCLSIYVLGINKKEEIKPCLKGLI